MTKKEIGNKGEEIARKYLESKQYEIIKKNFYTRHGEIDIIATKNKEIIFIEVKTRSNFLYGRPIEAITPIKLKHMYLAAKYYLYKNKLENCDVRFDAIEVYLSKGKALINHVKQII